MTRGFSPEAPLSVSGHNLGMKFLPGLVLVTAAVLPAQNTGITLSNTTDGYVEVPYSPQVVPQTGITVEAWITYDDASIPMTWTYPTIVRQNGNAGQESFFLRVNANNNAQRVLRWKVTANSVVNVDWPFAAGQLLTWTHVAGTWDGQTSRLFVNGQEVGSAIGSGPLRDQGDWLRIGKGSDVATPIEVWNGSIDEVRVWPFARTGAEIAATMNQELDRVPGEVSTWNLNGNANDSSAGRHATVSGAVTYTPGPTNLTTLTYPGVAFGSSTNGCRGAILSTTASLPQLGNAGFSMIAHGLATGAPTIAVLAGQGAPTPVRIVGVDLWLDTGTLIGGFGATVDPLGTARLSFGIPTTLTLPASLAVQFVAIDPCGPLGLTASDSIVFALIP